MESNVADSTAAPVETTPAAATVETTTQTPDTTSQVGQPAGQSEGTQDYKALYENTQKALKQERERLREIRRSGMNGNRQSISNSEVPEDVMNHPVFQEMLVKQAESELKQGVTEMLTRYPNLPKNVAQALIRNPRGFVQPTTADVQNALVDIEEYIEDIYGEFTPQTPSPTPPSIKVMGGNQLNQSGSDVEIQALLKKPPESLTDAEMKILTDYAKRNK